MPRTELRIYYGPGGDEPAGPDPLVGSVDVPPRELLEVPLSDVVTVLADAIQTGRGWLKDFGDERVTISRDLFEVLQAYQQLRRSAA
jgi:hypothetical protein